MFEGGQRREDWPPITRAAEDERGCGDAALRGTTVAEVD